MGLGAGEFAADRQQLIAGGGVRSQTRLPGSLKWVDWAAGSRYSFRKMVIPLYALRARRRGCEVSAVKAMMDLAGLAGGPVRPPLVDLRAEEIKFLQTALEHWQPWLEGAS